MPKKGSTTASTTARGYGWKHQQERKRWTRRVAAGEESCARCGLPIHPDEPFDLDHNAERTGYLGASHRRCNRATAGRQPRRRVARRRTPAPPKDDPKRGIYWGPPGVNGEHFRWSRPWYDWRSKEPDGVG